MSKYLLCFKTLLWVPLAGLALFASPALAVDDVGLFELEGDALADGAVDGDDWETLCDPVAVPGGACQNFGPDPGTGASPQATTFTGIKPDPAPNSIFDGGKKDIQDVSDWTGKDGAVPDKGDITNAYAAAYNCPPGESGCTEGDLIVYFGADRIINNGDTFMGFWFFKDDVSFDSVTGEFSGNHFDGDTLVLVNFPQATNAVPLIRVVQWDAPGGLIPGGCTKADNNNPQPGQCAAKNLRLIAGAEGAGAICGGVSSDPNFCAITNAEGGINDPTDSPWPYLSKDGFVNEFPFETFFEGGINLGALTGEACFASFMAETRSSSSFTASLKDFSLDQFPVCAVELSKVCGTGTYDPSLGKLNIPYSVTVTNTGSGVVQSVVATDDDCGFGTTTLNFGPLAADASETKDGFCSIPAGEDISGGITNGVSAIADGGDTVVTLAGSCLSGPSPDSCYSACSFNLSPDIGVTKRCRTQLLAEDDVVKVNVEFAGEVTNTSNLQAFPVPLEFVSVSDDKAGGPLELFDADGNSLGFSIGLDPGESAFFDGSYLPDGTGDFFDPCPSTASFMDTVTASGVDIFEGTSVEDFDSATCDLCTTTNCEDL
jgi:hypothetical protein